MIVTELKAEVMFEFIGETNADLGYIKGREYDLKVIHRDWLSRVIGVFYRIPYSWTVVVVKPFPCPYDSIEAFQANWKYKRLSIKG